MEGMAINRHYPMYAAAKKWEEALEIASALIQNCPENALGWIDRSFSLHEVNRTAEARDNLLTGRG